MRADPRRCSWIRLGSRRLGHELRRRGLNLDALPDGPWYRTRRFAATSRVARPGLEPGTPRFSGTRRGRAECLDLQALRGGVGGRDVRGFPPFPVGLGHDRGVRGLNPSEPAEATCGRASRLVDLWCRSTHTTLRAGSSDCCQLPSHDRAELLREEAPVLMPLVADGRSSSGLGSTTPPKPHRGVLAVPALPPWAGPSDSVVPSPGRSPRPRSW
jgi:hypothetical protein